MRFQSLKYVLSIKVSFCFKLFIFSFISMLKKDKIYIVEERVSKSTFLFEILKKLTMI